MSICSTLPEKQIEQNHNQLDGTIEFQNIHFSYPTRHNVKVQYTLNVELFSGMYVLLISLNFTNST